LTNAVSLVVAPRITALAPTASPNADGEFTLQPTCSPQVWPYQKVTLLLGNVEVPATPDPSQPPSPTTTPSFVFRQVPPGTYWVRLRVDGIDSLLVDRSTTPPTFVGPKVQVL
jgi:hypothetical protein